jgi:hypothetical protein
MFRDITPMRRRSWGAPGNNSIPVDLCQSARLPDTEHNRKAGHGFAVCYSPFHI